MEKSHKIEHDNNKYQYQIAIRHVICIQISSNPFRITKINTVNDLSIFIQSTFVKQYATRSIER